jgi:hypothetical protein
MGPEAINRRRTYTTMANKNSTKGSTKLNKWVIRSYK